MPNWEELPIPASFPFVKGLWGIHSDRRKFLPIKTGVRSISIDHILDSRRRVQELHKMKTAILSLLLALQAYARVTGSPSGFAAGTTGGGSATPAAPSSLDEYASLLLLTPIALN
jgi:hypothetical protein